MSNLVQKAREIGIFGALETTRGTYVFPVGSDVMRIIRTATPNQQPSYTDSEEVADTRSMPDRFQDAFPAGSLNLSHYMRIAAAGSAPEHSVLYEAAWGSKTAAASLYTYLLAKTKPSFSLLLKGANYALGLRGCVIDTVKTATAKKGAIIFEHSIKFMQMMWCGKVDYAAGMTYTTLTKKIVLPTAPGDDHDKFSAGMRVKIWDADAGGTGAYLTDGTNAYFLIASSNTADNSIVLGAEITGGWTPAANDRIEPWAPTVSLPTTSIIEARSGKTYRTTAGTGAISVLTSAFQLADNVTMLDEEQTDSGYPEDYSEGARKVTIDSEAYLRADDIRYYGRANRKVTTGMYIEGCDPAVAPLRTIAMQIACPKALGSFPELSGDKEQKVKVAYACLYNAAYEDECTLKVGNLTA